MMEGYSSDSSEGDTSSTLDLSHLSFVTSALQKHLEMLLENNRVSMERVESLLLFNNNLLSLPPSILNFQSLRVLDISSNGLKNLPSVLAECRLSTLIAKNNDLHADSFPKSLGLLETTLKELNLSGNNLTSIPDQILEIKSLKYLFLGSNRIMDVPKDIKKLISLQVLYLGGNCVTEVPTSVGQLTALTALVLCDNQLESLPSAIANLKSLRSLLLHRNKIRTLPQEIIALKGLSELSLRDNPLVVRFVREMTHQPPPSLLELAARAVQTHRVSYGPEDLPTSLISYLSTAHHCVNPECQGVFFDSRVEHIKFVDFCGKYRVPLLQYLCSERCVGNVGCASEEDEAALIPGGDHLLRKVLLG